MRSCKEKTMADVFPAHTTETAPEEARPALAAAMKQLGFVPTMMAKFAEAPLLLQAYQVAAGLFDKTSFSPTERLVVLLTASYLDNCDFCMSAHSWGAGRQGLDVGVIASLREGRTLADTRLEALRVFVRALVLGHGAVTEANRQAFFAAGFTPRQALEAVPGVATKVMTNYTNALAVTPPNAEFGDAVWQRRG
jgi:alkylhydroperoxidase family enzyme